MAPAAAEESVAVVGTAAITAPPGSGQKRVSAPNTGAPKTGGPRTAGGKLLSIFTL